MRGSTVALIALGVAGAAAGVYFLVIRPKETPSPTVQALNNGAVAATAVAGVAGKAVSGTFGLANTVARGTFGLLNTAVATPARIVGDVAGVAKTVVTTAAAIPVQAVSAAAHFAGTAVKTTVAIPAKAVSTVAHAASSVGHAIASLF